MKQQESMYGLWRRVHSHLREDADLETVTEEANALLPRLEETEESIRSLIKQNAHLSKTLVGQLKNLAADFERQALSERSALEQKLGDIQKTFEQKNRSLQKELDKQLQQQQQAADENAGKLLAVIAGQNDLLDKDRTTQEKKFDDLLKSFEQKNRILQKEFEKNLQQQQQAADKNAANILGVIAEQNELLEQDRKALDQKIGGIEKSFDQKNGTFQKQVEKNLQQQQQVVDKNAGEVLAVVSGQNELLEQERKVLEQKLEGIHESFEKKNHLLQKEFEKKLHQLQLSADGSSEKLLDVVARQNELLKQEQKTMASKLDQACGAVAGVDGSITGVREYLAEQNQIQRRYQEGYDFQILKNFVAQIARIIDRLEAQIEKPRAPGKKELKHAHEQLIELLAENGVEQIRPALGAVYDDAAQETAELDGTVNPSSADQEGTIAEVVRPGYNYTFTSDEAQSRCLQKAKIKIYRATEEE